MLCGRLQADSLTRGCSAASKVLGDRFGENGKACLAVIDLCQCFDHEDCAINPGGNRYAYGLS